MGMGRRRKHRRDLPQRVYFDHGSYFFVPGKGGKVNLGREFVQAWLVGPRSLAGPRTSIR